jgi:hypothetical protein
VVGTVRRVLATTRQTVALVLFAALLCGVLIFQGAIMSTLWSVHPLLSVAAAVPVAAALGWLSLKVCTAGQKPGH